MYIILLAIILIPLLTSFFLLFVNNNNNNLIRTISIYSTSITFFISLIYFLFLMRPDCAKIEQGGGVRQFGAKYITGGNPVW